VKTPGFSLTNRTEISDVNTEEHFIKARKFYKKMESESEFQESYSEASANSDVESSGDESLAAKFNGLQPFLYEPEPKSTLEKNKQKLTEKSTKRYEEKTKRVGNKNWCCCNKCHEEEREIDCLCCQELGALNEKQIEGWLRF
jgi:hypothetical protein